MANVRSMNPMASARGQGDGRRKSRENRPTNPATTTSSLIPQTLMEMAEESEEQKQLRKRVERGELREMAREEANRRREATTRVMQERASRAPSGATSSGYDTRHDEDIDSFEWATRRVEPLGLRKRSIHSVVVCVGVYCNQACSHCHVDSSPLRKREVMNNATADRVLELLAKLLAERGVMGADGRVGPIAPLTLDLTGGAPELCPAFRRLVTGAREIGVSSIIDRCNLTVLMESGQEDLPQFLAENGVRVVASLPCYTQENVDGQRGRGVFDRSIAGLHLLNEHGYGIEGSGLVLDLMYNPSGAFLPPSQAKLEPAFKEELRTNYGIVFNSLITLTNLPIKRFLDHLVRRDQLDSYMGMLVDNFNPSTLDRLMCRDGVSVDWNGDIYDCDFNQQLMLNPDFPALASAGGRGTGQSLNVFSIPSFSDLTGQQVKTGSHCFGCTAGSGSS